jgi:sulfur carrier protein
LNGEERQVKDGATVATLVRSLNLEGRPVAIELNRRVIPRALFEETALQEGDSLELVTFVGGG